MPIFTPPVVYDNPPFPLAPGEDPTYMLDKYRFRWHVVSTCTPLVTALRPGRGYPRQQQHGSSRRIP